MSTPIPSNNDRAALDQVLPRSTATRVGLLVVLGAIVVLALTAPAGTLSALDAIVLGAVEGITEFLPISSTGHLLVTQRLLGLGEGADKAAADVYAVAIQLGAIAAVLVLYWSRLMQMLRGLFGRDAEGARILTAVVVAFLPAAFVGALFGDTIKDHVFGPWPVVVAWLAGGVFLLVWRPRSGGATIADITARHALIIGAAQVLALWPGTSRSLTTIVAASLLGFTMSAAVEFGFLLGLLTLSAATVLDLAKDGSTLRAEYGWHTPLLGGLVAFVTAVVAVRWLVSYLRTRPLTIFGWYRIGIAALTVALLVTNVI